MFRSLNIASGEANLIDNISRRKKNLSVDIDYNHKPESNRARLNADFNDYRATRYLMAAEWDLSASKVYIVIYINLLNDFIFFSFIGNKQILEAKNRGSGAF